MLYLLDTCTFSYLEDRESPFNKNVLVALRALADTDEVCLSILSIYELEYGLKRAPEAVSEEVQQAKRHALKLYQILPLSSEGAVIFANIKNRYRERLEERMIPTELTKHLARHTVDLMIASSAMEHGGTVVSNDRIFKSLHDVIPELTVTDWTASGTTEDRRSSMRR